VLFSPSFGVLLAFTVFIIAFHLLSLHLWLLLFLKGGCSLWEEASNEERTSSQTRQMRINPDRYCCYTRGKRSSSV
jgi:hypothetical protein